MSPKGYCDFIVSVTPVGMMIKSFNKRDRFMDKINGSFKIFEFKSGDNSIRSQPPMAFQTFMLRLCLANRQSFHNFKVLKSIE